MCLFNQNQTPRSDSANLEPTEPISTPKLWWSPGPAFRYDPERGDYYLTGGGETQQGPYSSKDLVSWRQSPYSPLTQNSVALARLQANPRLGLCGAHSYRHGSIPGHCIAAVGAFESSLWAMPGGNGALNLGAALRQVLSCDISYRPLKSNLGSAAHDTNF